MFKIIAGIFGVLLGIASPSFALHVTKIEFEGLERTNPKWLETYLNVDLPTEVDDLDVTILTQKLLNTNVFYNIEVKLVPDSNLANEGTLLVKVAEKWTLIPVVRGAFGGGTPLYVLGAFDTHAFGSLWTVGAELRQYGEAPLSYLLWASAPRWRYGEHLLSFKFWQNNRQRDLLDKDYEKITTLTSKMTQGHMSFYFPRKLFGLKLQTGLDLNYYAVQPLSFKRQKADFSADFDAPAKTGDEFRPLFNLIYDDIKINYINQDGLRLILRGGIAKNTDGIFGNYEGEAFYYKLFPDDWNLAWHIYGYLNTARQFQDIYFLGGLDSIRGLPEGGVYGNRAYFTNFEIRKVLTKQESFWLQANAFVDGGNAGWDWDETFEDIIASAGVGISIAIPRVNRLVLRFDYAWSLTEPSFDGISFGFNSFFQPYKPF